MGKNALVLGGGGVLGVSWATGMLAGLAEGGVDAAGAELMVGTSAGSVVAAQAAVGRTVDELMVRQSEPDAGPPVDFDPANLMAIFQKWAAFPEMTVATCAEIGAMAIASRTPKVESWLETFAEIAGEDWPERKLIVTAVDADSGAFQPWERASGVSLQIAVASSCTVPGLFPVVPINGRRYMDGGVRSTTNADLANGYDSVLVLAPIGARNDGIDPLSRRISQAEIAALHASGSDATLVFPDAESLEAMGINRMDVTRRAITAEAGTRQGERLAKLIAGAWSKAAV
jgi:NTE family protein